LGKIIKAMAKISKNRKAVLAKYNPEKEYSLEDASKLIKEITFTKFDASVDIDIRLGVDPKKSDQMVRGVVALPHGIGKTVRVLVLCTPDKVQEAKDAGAEHVGLDEFIQKIEGGWTDIDVIICTPTVMAKVGKLGKILGPRGLMPNPKSGTVTLEVGKAVKEVKAGKIDFKIDKQGIIHVSVGKASFSADKIRDNAAEMINVVAKLKPASAKGAYFQSITLSTTMSPGVSVDTNSVAGI
jgi:large subunit ribosomal protein L1